MNDLILAGMNSERLVSWKRVLGNFVIRTLLIDGMDKLLKEVEVSKPQVVLLDFDMIEMNVSNSAAILRRLCADVNTIIIANGEMSEDMEWELLKTGVRGCCKNEAHPKFLGQVVNAVQQGELWIRRSLTRRLVDELGKSSAKNKSYRAALSSLNKLTPREYDIAVRVGNGETNKQIALACSITERTVKAHLTEIFMKLGVTDRLNLALVLSADNRNSSPNSVNSDSGSKTNLNPLGGSRADDENSKIESNNRS